MWQLEMWEDNTRNWRWGRWLISELPDGYLVHVCGFPGATYKTLIEAQDFIHSRLPSVGYHTTPITKGTYGELSKVREELEEAEDAEKQGAKIMLQCELADLFGALRAYAAKCGLSVSDLTIMADATERAFTAGERK